jgi:hypothetical protein
VWTTFRILVVEPLNMPFLKTPAAADLPGVAYWRLIGLLRSKRLPAPQKDSSGDYLWTPEDIERARQALAVRRVGGQHPNEESR